MPYLLKDSSDLMILYSVEPLIILQCPTDHLAGAKALECDSITESKAPLATKDMTIRGGSNAVDVSMYFPERNANIIFGALHTRVTVTGISKQYVTYVEVPVLCAWEHNGASSKIIYLSDPLWSQQLDFLNFPVSLSIKGDTVTVIVNHFDASNQIIKVPLQKIVQEIQESIEKDDVPRNLNNFIDQNVKKMNQELSQSRAQ